MFLLPVLTTFFWDTRLSFCDVDTGLLLGLLDGCLNTISCVFNFGVAWGRGIQL